MLTLTSLLSFEESNLLLNSTVIHVGACEKAPLRASNSLRTTGFVPLLWLTTGSEFNQAIEKQCMEQIPDSKRCQ